jgi:von Willebrand factor type A domain
MPCLSLSNGNFSIVQFSTANANVGSVTVTRTATQITIAHTSYSSSLVLNGRFESHVYAAGTRVALLRFIDGAPGSSQRTTFIVDFTVPGNTPGLVQVHEQGNQLNAIARPQLELSPGNASLIFVWSSSGQPNEAQRFTIARSDNGQVVLNGPLVVSGLNGNIGASITAANLIIDHFNQNSNDQTTGPRPTGLCNIVDNNPQFGEAVLGAANAALATVTRAVTIRNDGLDCLTITAIANSAPYSVTAASLAMLPKVLDPGQEFDVDILFAPTAVSNNIDRTLVVTTNPANGDTAIDCEGSARMAVAQISTSTNSLAFGTLVHPGTDTKNYTVSNTGEIALSITIAAAPGGSDFGWAPIVAPGLALAVGASTPARPVTFTTAGDLTSTPRTITVVPSTGASRTINCTGAGCIPNAAITVPPAAPLTYGTLERGFRTVRFVTITNTGDDDLTFTARIAPGAVPAQAANFGLVLPENDITDAPSQRAYSVLPDHRCGPGATGLKTVEVAASFFADGANGIYSADLIIEGHNATNQPAAMTWTFPLSGEIIDPVPVDIALVLDRSGSMNDVAWSRNKMEAALSGAKLLVQMLRDGTGDRCAVIGFNSLPVAHQPIVLAGPNRAALLATLAPPTFVPGGSTNVAGGAIVAAEQLALAHPDNPPVLKKAMVVLTDGQENNCFQIGGAGTWYSITGRDSNENMRRPDGTPQDTDPWPAPVGGTKVYAIGLGAAGQVDDTALTLLASTTGASYQGAEDLSGKNYFRLEKYFTQIFMETAGLAQISDPFFTILPGEKHPHDFDILPGDVNAMVVIYDEPGQRLPFHVVSPKGEIISGNSLPPGFSLRFRSTPTARFAEFFFPNKDPGRYVGRWTVWVEHAGYVCDGEVGSDKDKGHDKDSGHGFLPRKCHGTKDPVDYGIAIGAGSNLRMQPYVEPGVKYVGDTIRLNAEVAEAGLPVKNANVKVQITAPNGQSYSVQLKDDGQNQDGQPHDGDYGGLFTQTYMAGNYQMTFTADGVQGIRPYHREAHRTKAVLDPRRPPGGSDDGGGGSHGGGDGGGDCCRKLLRALSRQERLLIALLKDQKN